jgi:hypothetical protein
MRRIILALAIAAIPTFLNPTPAHAQYGLGGGLYQQRLAEQQVVRWFQAYLGRLPNGQELAILTNQYALSGNGLYVQSIILASNEFYIRSGGTPLGFINRLFVTTLGRQPTVQEASMLQAQPIQYGRLYFVQAFLSNISGGWQLSNWNTAVAAVPVPVVVPIVIR